MNKVNRKRTTEMNFHSVGSQSHLPYVEKYKKVMEKEVLTHLNTNAKREICWDFYPVERKYGITLRSHKPQKKNIAFRGDDFWEGTHNGYMSCVKVGDTFRIYYRAAGRCQDEGEHIQMKDYEFSVCVVESKDGKTFAKPKLSNFNHMDCAVNNIVFASDRPTLIIDNFYVFYDTNPACPDDEKFKALSCDSEIGNTLSYYKSSDGYKFEFVRCLDLPGNFDCDENI